VVFDSVKIKRIHFPDEESYLRVDYTTNIPLLVKMDWRLWKGSAVLEFFDRE
jgi:hypothetical protein